MSIELEQTPALVVIDLQSGILGQPTAHPLDRIIDNSARLAAAFRARGLPVVLVNVEGTAPGRTERGKASGRSGARTLPAPATVLLPQLNRQPSDITVTKRSVGAFLSTDLDAKLKEVGATQIVLTGVSTTSGCGGDRALGVRPRLPRRLRHRRDDRRRRAAQCLDRVPVPKAGRAGHDRRGACAARFAVVLQIRRGCAYDPNLESHRCSGATCLTNFAR